MNARHKERRIYGSATSGGRPLLCSSLPLATAAFYLSKYVRYKPAANQNQPEQRGFPWARPLRFMPLFGSPKIGVNSRYRDVATATACLPQAWFPDLEMAS